MANAVERLQTQIGMVQEWMEGTVGDCSAETCNRVFDQATIGSIGSIYAHALFSEDKWINSVLQGKPKVYDQHGWQAKIGADLHAMENGQDVDFSRGAKLDLATLRAYGQEVHAATKAYLSSISEADLDKKFETGFAGQQTAVWIIDLILVTHYPTHMGEIAALKGLQSMKGLPF